jgi:F0F1-type ATP synthase membrane subunit b/b'
MNLALIFCFIGLISLVLTILLFNKRKNEIKEQIAELRKIKSGLEEISATAKQELDNLTDYVKGMRATEAANSQKLDNIAESGGFKRVDKVENTTNTPKTFKTVPKG